MRAPFAFAFLLAVAACGNGGPPGSGGDDDPTVDAGGGGGNPDAPIEPPARGFQVVSPPVEVMPGQEITYCYYFRTPNTETMAVNRWQSDMTPGSHHMIMYTSTNEIMPAGTITAEDCGIGAGQSTSFPAWTYAAQTPQFDLQLPQTDGGSPGKPLAMEIAPSTPAFFQMHYYNPSDNPLQVQVTLNAYALDKGEAFTKTAVYVTYNSNIEIPPMAVNHVEPAAARDASCTVPANSKFWMMSTHSHKQSVKTRVLDGASVVFESTDWEHPGETIWDGTPGKDFYTFASGKLTYECTYTNQGANAGRTIYDGDSAAINEMCMASGYYFPATGPKFCINNFAF